MRKEDLLPLDENGNLVLDKDSEFSYPVHRVQKAMLFSMVKEDIRKNADTKTHTAAVLVVHNGKFLVGDRSDDKGICGPGGHAQWGETPVEAAKREAWEEFGIRPKNLRPLNGKKFGEGTVYFWTDEFFGEPKTDDKEMFRPRWLSTEEVKRQKALPNFEESIDLYLKQKQEESL